MTTQAVEAAAAPDGGAQLDEGVAAASAEPTDATLTSPSPAPDTAAPDATPEQDDAAGDARPDPASVLAGMSEDELAELEPVRNILEARQAATRQEAEAEAARTASEQRRQQLLTGEATAKFAEAFSVDEEGQLVRNEEVMQASADAFFQGSTDYAVRVLGGLIDELVPSDFAMSREQGQKLGEALKEFEANPVQGARSLIHEYVTVAQRAAVDAERESLRAEIDRELRAEYADRQTVDQRREAEQSTATQAQPLRGVGGNAGGAWGSQAEIDRAHARGEMTTEQYRQLYVDGTYASLP